MVSGEREILMETSPNSENQGSAEAVHAQPPGSPVQFVVVQQNPADDDRESVGKFIEGLLGATKEDEGEAADSSARKLTVKLSQHNLLVVIALLILAGSQLVEVVLRFYENKKDKGSQTQQLDLPTVLALGRAILEANQAATAAQQAASDARRSATAAEKDASAAPQPSRARIDPDLKAALIAAMARPSSSHSAAFIPIPYPTFVPSATTPTPPAPGMGEHKIPVRPDFAMIPPCFEEFTLHNMALLNSTNPDIKNAGKPCSNLTLSVWKERFSAVPATEIVVHYQNRGKSDLELLDFQAFLDIIPHPGAQGVAGVCPYPKTGYQPWKAGEPNDQYVELKLGPFWSSAEKKKAQTVWDKGPLYLTLCTTVRLPGSVPVLDRTVFMITVDGQKSATLDPNVPFENETIVLQ
jgi:hypothetical protein